MNIEPGTRVRSTESIPALVEGEYVEWDGMYHVINWDKWNDGIERLGYHHFDTEFEVI